MTIVSCVLLVLMAAMFVNLGWQLLKYELCLHFGNRYVVKISYTGKVTNNNMCKSYSINALNEDYAALEALNKLFESEDRHIEHIQHVAVIQVYS